MEKFNTLADAIRVAEVAHFKQLDKADKAGLPYIDHPKRVLATVQAQGVQPYVQMAAVLHDVPEDTAFSHDILLGLGFSEAVVELTKLLDRGYSKREYERRYSLEGASNDDIHEYYYENIKKSRDATIIKLADIRDNLSGWRLAYFSGDTQKRLRDKYAKALEILNPAPVNHGMITGYRHDPFTL